MDPRISFSNDFVESQPAMKMEKNIYRDAPVSSDFEFSVKNKKMIPADEIFFEGVLLPLKDNSRMTLRDELLVEDEFEGNWPKISKSSGWWKERLGFKRVSHLAKNVNKNEVVLQRVEEEKRQEAKVGE